MEADQEPQEATAGSDEQQHDEGEEEEEEQHPPPAEEAEVEVEAAAAAREGAEEGDEEEEEDGEGGASPRALRPSFPPGRVKKIVKLDREIGRVNSEALHLISLSADLFLCFLAGKAGEVALRNKKKSVRIDHLSAAARDHQPTGDFLLDSLPQLQAPTIPPPAARRPPGPDKPLPPGARRIDEFFRKSSPAAIE